MFVAVCVQNMCVAIYVAPYECDSICGRGWQYVTVYVTVCVAVRMARQYDSKYNSVCDSVCDSVYNCMCVTVSTVSVIPTVTECAAVYLAV